MPMRRLPKLRTTKYLRHDVGELVLSAHELDVSVATVNTLTNEMIPSLNVFAWVMEDRVLHQADCCFFVDTELDRAIIVSKQLALEPPEPDALTRRYRRPDTPLPPHRTKVRRSFASHTATRQRSHQESAEHHWCCHKLGLFTPGKSTSIQDSLFRRCCTKNASPPSSDRLRVLP
jgi:hypothetical protein